MIRAEGSQPAGANDNTVIFEQSFGKHFAQNRPSPAYSLAATELARLRRAHREVDRLPERVRDRVEQHRDRPPPRPPRPTTDHTVGMSGEVAIIATAPATMITANVKIVLAVTAPSSKPSSPRR